MNTMNMPTSFQPRLFANQGYIEVTERLLETFWKYITVYCTLEAVEFIPLEITYNYSSKSFKITAMCDKFETLPDGATIPHYYMRTIRKLTERKTGKEKQKGQIKEDDEVNSMTDGEVTIEEVIEIEGFERV